ncbi:MAG: hypothetical protein CMO40_03725 [Verrucomicrobiaceae bacterium]|nr:hypothetical protein [Verrucomicrobiaceae bacterium]
MKSVHLLRWLHHFKALVLLATGLTILGCCVGIYVLNSHGFAGRWSERIEAELTRRGIHAEFESVRFSPTRGIIAKKVSLFTDESRNTELARIPVLRFDVDRGKAFRGELQIRSVQLQKARLSVGIGDGQSLQIDNLTGRASVDRSNRLRLRADRAKLGGMQFKLNVELDGFELANLRGNEDQTTSERRASFTRDLLEELANWSFPGSIPPVLEVNVKGNLDRPTGIRTSISLSATELTRRDYTMEDVSLTGILDNRTLSITELGFSDGAGRLTLQAHYDLEDKTGGYEGSSSIQIADLLRDGLQDDTLSQFISPRAPRLEARGKFAVTDEELRLSAIGSLSCGYFRFLGVPFEKIDTKFSWQNGNIYLRDLKVRHEQGELVGEIKIQDDLVQYRARTSLPLSAYRPFMQEDSGPANSLARSSFTDQSRILVDTRGSIQRSNLRDWDATGSFRIENFCYNDVPITLAAADFYITPLDSIFDNVEAVFDYRDYGQTTSAGGPASGTLRARQIHYDSEAGLTSLTELHGQAWPGPILRLFVPSTADLVEQNYRFRAPPRLTVNGLIDHRSTGERSDVLAEIEAEGLTDFSFLGQSLQLADLTGQIRSRHLQTDVLNLSLRTLGGTIQGDVTHRSQPSQVSVRLRCQDLDAALVGQTYQLSEAVRGSLTAFIAADAVEKTVGDGTTIWHTNGTCTLGPCNYNGVALTGGSARFQIVPEGSTWTEGKLDFDYSEYPPRQQHGGPGNAEVEFDRIEFNRTSRLTRLVNLRGTAWPAPLLRLVDSGGADFVEETFGFRRPPEIEVAGRYDHNKNGSRTLFESAITCKNVIDYSFLDRDLLLREASARVKTTRNRHEVSDLFLRAFGGTIGGKVTITSDPGKPSRTEAGIRWDRLSLEEIGRAFNFEKAALGSITGRIDLTTRAGQTETLNGQGVIGLRDGQLFNVPVFGPLSLPLGTVLGRTFSHEQARDASATFVFKNGTAFTKDFLTSTPSTTFVGEGSINLVEKKVDLTMRMNARGLLGLVTLPITPLKGFFQFRGQGPIKKPVWSPAPFTQPAGGPGHPIFKDPPRAQVVPER